MSEDKEEQKGYKAIIIKGVRCRYLEADALKFHELHGLNFKDEIFKYAEEVVAREQAESKKVMYAIGQDDGKGGYGMWDGPNPSEEEMLEVEGRDSNSVIIRFNADGTDEVIWRWMQTRWTLALR